MNIGKYRVLRLLATGGMAEIFLALVQGVGGFERLVVLKRILPQVAQDETVVEMFINEAKIASSLRHANIVDVFDVGLDGDSHFLVMEYVFGQDARTIILEAAALRQRIPLEIGIAAVAGAATALAYAHDVEGDSGPLGLVHRDVSPSNILVSYDGAVKLVDFGIARATARSKAAFTRSGKLNGKVPYMSPEQCQGLRLDRRSDLFSLGIVLYELTTGTRPFMADGDFALMDNIVNRDAQPPSASIPDYPRDLEAIVMKLLARKLRDRYQDAHQVVADLDAFASRHKLGVSSLAVREYMRALFAAELEESEQATRLGRSLGEHLAEAPSRAERLRARIVEYPAIPRDAFTLEDNTRQTGAPSLVRPMSSDFELDPSTRTEPTRAFADPLFTYRAELEDELRGERDVDHPDRVSRRFKDLVDRAAVSLALGDVDRAVVTAELAMAQAPATALGDKLIEVDRDTLLACFDTYLGDTRRDVLLVRQLEDLACLPLGPRAAFLLSRIDGLVSIDDLIDTAGMPRLHASRHLCQLLVLGILSRQ